MISLKILIVRLTALGDTIHTVPALCALRKDYPQARIHWVVDRKCHEILKNHPDLDKLHILDPSPSGFRRMIAELRRERFDIAIDFQGLLKSAVLAGFSGAPRRLGRSSFMCREPLAALFTNERIHPRERHIILQNLELLRLVGIQTRETDYRLALPSVELPSVFSRSPVGIHVGGSWPTKKSPAEKFGLVARKITEEIGLPVLVFHGPGEEEEVRTVCRLAPAAEPAPPLSFMEMAGFFARCAAVGSSETGPMHLAVAVGAPVVCLIGVTDPLRNGPLSPKARAVLPPPPHQWTYRRTGENPTRLIAVDNVIRALLSVLEE